MTSSWSAPFISPDADPNGAPLLRRVFRLDAGHGAVKRASLAISALGIVEAWLAGRPVSDELFTPGWTSYEWRIRVRTYDVADHLNTLAPGDPVVVGAALGNGWYRGRLTWTGGSAYYGNELGLFLELQIEFEDGHIQRIQSDEDWTAAPSATTANDLYDGQDIDARAIDPRWLEAAFDDTTWGGVHTLDVPRGELVPHESEPVRRIDEIQPQKVWTSPAGSILVDFGQNLVGWVKMSVKGPSGSVVTLRHAEVLEHEEIGVRPLRSAKATDRFTLSGATDVFEPTLTFHGFRYVEIDGWPGTPDDITGAITAVVVSSDLRRIGTFETSNPLVNRLHENVVWGMRGNFLDVPTDCPQRDERLGWTGDIAVFAPTAAFLFDSNAFLRDWLRDLTAEQSHADGIVPFVVPDVLKLTSGISVFGDPETIAIWSDAAVWVPWALYQAYGNSDVLDEQFESMLSHMRRVRRLLSPEGLWEEGFQFGDWLDPDAPPSNPFAAKADKGVVATACAYRSAAIVAEAAEILGRPSEAKEYRELAEHIRKGFLQHYTSADGTIKSDCATVYALGIEFGLLDEPAAKLAGRRLAELVATAGYKVATGFAGTPYVTDALTRTGHVDDAYRLLLEEGCPSWLYGVKMGATTIWERWDSMLPDGTINPGDMTSFNHYALGAVADWMHRTIGGIAPLSPGYAEVLIAPRPGGGITWAKTSLETPHGTVTVNWHLEGTVLDLDVTVPQGATAMLRLPGVKDVRLQPGSHRMRSAGNDLETSPGTNDDSVMISS